MHMYMNVYIYLLHMLQYDLYIHVYVTSCATFISTYYVHVGCVYHSCTNAHLIYFVITRKLTVHTWVYVAYAHVDVHVYTYMYMYNYVHEHVCTCMCVCSCVS